MDRHGAPPATARHRSDRLFAPQHAGERLAEDASPVLIEVGRRDRVVKGVSLCAPPGEGLVEGSVESGTVQPGPPQPQSHGCRARGRDIEQVVCGGLGTRLRWVDCSSTAVQQEIVDAVLDKDGAVGSAEDAPIVRLVVGKKESRGPIAVQLPDAELRVVGGDRVAIAGHAWLCRAGPASPQVSEPKRRK